MPDSTILVIDDDITTIKLIATTLKDEFNVIIATTAADGLNLSSSLPDLILLDVMMPEINGYELCRQLKENKLTQNIPVVFVTALSDTANQVKGFEIGAIDYITKPIETSILKMRVRTHCKLFKQSKQLERLAATDPLTTLANRRKFDEFFQSEWQRSVRKKSPITLLMIDIDDFKAYNDHYGHGRGDECLLVVSKCIRRCIKRSSDLVARVGGEEFAVVLTESDVNAGIEVAEQISQELNKQQLKHEYSSHSYVSVSIGIATAIPNLENSSHHLFERSDAAMYQAKRSGKNQYKVYQAAIGNTDILSNHKENH